MNVSQLGWQYQEKIILFHAIKITSNTEDSIPHILLLAKDVLQWTEECDS